MAKARSSSKKKKVWKAKDLNQPAFTSKYDVTKRWAGNCTDVIKNSNKFYHAEIQVASSGKARILTTYGRVGAKNPTIEYRYYSSEQACMNDFNSLVKKKRDRKKNPYREVDLAITSVGSKGAKEIKKPMTGLNVSSGVISNLHSEVQRLVSGWFGATGSFIEMNLKCPLGQLTTEHIDKGRKVLDDCLTRTKSKKRTGQLEYDNLTNQYYSLIPQILPNKIQASELRLNDVNKIMAQHSILDTFTDAKNVSSVLGKGAAIDQQYLKLKADLDYVEPNDPIYKWIANLILETRAKNHSHLGKIKIFNIFKLSRNGATDHFNKSLEKIAKEVSGKGTKPKYTNLNRFDLNKEEDVEFKQANVWPLWHGTRPENMVGIISKGLLIRPSGAVYTGSMFGDSLYFAENSSKSMNYTGCKGAGWSGSSGKSRAFLFLGDVIVGNPYVVKRSQFFRKPPAGHHSVYAVPGYALYNSENMIYNASGKGQQHKFRYIVEFQTRA